MQDDGDVVETVPVDMLLDPPQGLVQYVVGHRNRLAFPALVAHLEHIAVATGEIAPVVYFVNELLKWSRLPAGGQQPLDIELLRPLARAGTHDLRTSAVTAGSPRGQLAGSVRK